MDVFAGVSKADASVKVRLNLWPLLLGSTVVEPTGSNDRPTVIPRQKR